MTANSIAERKRRYFHLSSQIVQLDNAQLLALFETGESFDGWGRNHIVEIGESKVFVKRVAVTALEQENMFSTRNLYDLPIHYNYGVGSAGFGVFRELVAHIKTTNWVLNDEIANFPLLYHYRFMPFTGEHQARDPEKLQEYVTYWGGNENIEQFMRARTNAQVELVLMLEYFPHPMHKWFVDNLEQVGWVLDDLRTTVDFLRQNDIVHFDANFWNMLTDGERLYLTDFGLVLDRNFDLRDDEKAFFDAHTLYDYGQYITSLPDPLYQRFRSLPEAKQQQLRARFGLSEEGTPHREILRALMQEIETGELLNVDAAYRNALAQYQPIVALVGGFFSNMRHNLQKDTPFPHAELQRLLGEGGLTTVQ